MTDERPGVLLFVSLKTYFGYQQSRDWITDAAQVVSDARSAFDLPMEVAVFPEVASLSGVAPLFPGSGLVLGAQDVAPDDSGPQTGEVSARVLQEIGCTYVEIGHAERRLRFGESDELIAQKLANAVEHGLVPLICVGEDSDSSASAAELCVRQLESALAPLVASGKRTRVVIAYEPVHAIGASESAPLEHVFEVVSALRERADGHPAISQAQVIYGGSAGPVTVPALSSAIDGLFLGRFVHDPKELRRVIDAYAGAARAER